MNSVNVTTQAEMNVGEIIKTMRHDSNLTVRELAEKSGVSKSGVSRWENSERIPNVDVFIRILKAMNAELVVIKKEV